MYFAALLELAICWIAWWYPFLFRAPHWQKRASVTLPGPTRVGLLLETAAFFIAFLFHLPPGEQPGAPRILLSVVLGPLAVLGAWTSVTHLGRQFRITAGLWEDHELVRTGPYAVVRHPIYASLLGMLLSSMLLVTPWLWGAVALATFIAGTEIRVHTEDGLLASRFGASFENYRRHVRAYIPWVR